MKYFQEHFFTRSGNSMEWFDRPFNQSESDGAAGAICEEYKMELSWLRPKLSKSTQEFLQIEQSFHDEPINEILMTPDSVTIKVRSGSIRLWNILHLSFSLDNDCHNCWLYDEVVSPSSDSQLKEGYFIFNVLTQNGEISITAKDIHFIPSTN